MDFLDCKICQVPYDEEEHRPRHAPCGHELCSACIKALIKGGLLECPKCRQKTKVNVPDDLPINFGLIDVIRAFKTNKIPMSKKTKPLLSGATSDEVCKLHHKGIMHRCLTCQIWTCEECNASHSSLIGCSVISSNKAMVSMRKKHNETVDKQLTIFEKDVTHLAHKIQGHTNEKKKLLEKMESHDKEIRKLKVLLDEGNTLKEKLQDSKKDLNVADSPFTLSDRIEVLTQREQSLRIWSMKNLEESTEPNSRQDLLKELANGKKTYVEMIFKNEKKHSKLTQYEGNILLPSFKTPSVTSDCTYISFENLQKMMPKEPSLVFMELALGGVSKGRVLLRLDKSLPNIRDNMVTIFTGQLMESLAGTPLEHNGNPFLYVGPLSLSEVPVTPDRSGRPLNKSGDVVGYYNGKSLGHLFLNVGTTDWGGNKSYKVVGSIVAGMDVILECYNNHSSGVIIKECGLVIEK